MGSAWDSLKLHFEIGRHSDLTSCLQAASQWVLLFGGRNCCSHQVECTPSVLRRRLGSTWEPGSSIPPCYEGLQMLPDVHGGGEQMQSWLRTTALDHTTKDAGLACNLALPGSGLSFTLKAPTIECLHDARTWEMLLLPSVILILYIHIFFFFFFFKVTSSLNYWLSHILFLSFQTDKVAIELTSSVREACSLLFISSPSDLQGYWHINFGVRSSLVAQCVKDLALSPLSLCHCCGEDSIPGPGTSLCCGCGH